MPARFTRAPDRTFRIQDRDVAIVDAVFRHRYLTLEHILALLGGGSRKNIGNRLLLLYDHDYLDRPRAQEKIVIRYEDVAHGLGNKGALLLRERFPTRQIPNRAWTEDPGHARSLAHIHHELGIATFFVALQLACKRLGYSLLWGGHHTKDDYEIPLPPGSDATSRNSDGFFVIKHGEDGRAYFLEIDRSGDRNPERLRRKFEGYFRWWDVGNGRRVVPYSRSGFRVLTVARNFARMQVLRRAATPVGVNADYAYTWRALLFTHLGEFSLAEPEKLFLPIFRYADNEAPVSMLGRLAAPVERAPVHA